MMTDSRFDPKVYLQQGNWGDMRLGLSRIRALLEALGNPQDDLAIVHVAGTNGKGSTSAFTAGICQAAGLKTGLFTSPYVIEFNERIQIDRCNITDEDLLAVTLRVRDIAEKMEDHPSAFELLTAVALRYFADCACDIVVLEVGLGGRLDSTNAVDHPLVSVITPISLDHTAVLGDTLAAIASEKAGIIKPGVPVVCHAQQPEAAEVIRARCMKLHAPLSVPRFARCHAHVEDGMQVFSYDGIDDVHLRLSGSYQPGNAVMAIEVARLLRTKGFAIDDDAIKEGLEATRWPGRFEIVRRNPTVVVDGGHNEQGARVLAESLRACFPGRRVVFVMGVLRDKHYPEMISQIAPLAECVYTVTPPDGERALSAAELAGALADAGVAEAVPAPSIPDACRSALRRAGDEGIVCCFGSLYSIHDVMEALQPFLALEN